LTHDKELLSKLFSCLASIDIIMVSYGGSAHNVSVLIPTESKNDTLRLLNKGIFGFA